MRSPTRRFLAALISACLLHLMGSANAQLAPAGPQGPDSANSVSEQYLSSSDDEFSQQLNQDTYTIGKEQRYQDLLACLRYPDGSAPASMEDFLFDLDVAGATLVILEGGRVDRVEHFGFEDIEGGDLTDASTFYSTASMSKFLAGIAAAEAHRQGIVLLRKSLRDYADELNSPILDLWLAYKFTGASGDYPDDIKLKNLLSHSAGLDTWTLGTYPAGREKSQTDYLLGESALDWVRDDVGVLPTSPPRTVMAYSGGGFVAVEVILESATGSSYADWATANILQPLGMFRSTYDMAVTGMPNLATRCGWSDLTDLVQCQNQGSLVKTGTGFLAHPQDYARLLEIINAGGYDENGALVLDPAVITDVLTPAHHQNSSLAACSVDTDCTNASELCFLGKCKQMLANNVPGEDYYGLGVTVSDERLPDGLPRYLSHGGVGDGYAADFRLDRQTGRGFVFMTNGALYDGAQRSVMGVLPVDSQVRTCWNAVY